MCALHQKGGYSVTAAQHCMGVNRWSTAANQYPLLLCIQCNCNTGQWRRTRATFCTCHCSTSSPKANLSSTKRYLHIAVMARKVCVHRCARQAKSACIDAQLKHLASSYCYAKQQTIVLPSDSMTMGFSNFSPCSTGSDFCLIPSSSSRTTSSCFATVSAGWATLGACSEGLRIRKISSAVIGLENMPNVPSVAPR